MQHGVHTMGMPQRRDEGTLVCTAQSAWASPFYDCRVCAYDFLAFVHLDEVQVLFQGGANVLRLDCRLGAQILHADGPGVLL